MFAQLVLFLNSITSVGAIEKLIEPCTHEVCLDHPDVWCLTAWQHVVWGLAKGGKH